MGSQGMLRFRRRITITTKLEQISNKVLKGLQKKRN